jgi:hypothetical protein
MIHPYRSISPHDLFLKISGMVTRLFQQKDGEEEDGIEKGEGVEEREEEEEEEEGEEGKEKEEGENEDRDEGGEEGRERGRRLS